MTLIMPRPVRFQALPVVPRPMIGPVRQQSPGFSALRFLGSKKTAEVDFPVGQHDTSNMMIFTGRGNPKLARDVARLLGIRVSPAEVKNFNGRGSETYVNLNASVRGKDIYLIQPSVNPVNENLVETCMMLDAFKRSDARTINLIMPQFAYARGDRKAEHREAIAAKVVAKMFEAAGATHVMTMDLHAKQVQGFFDIPADSLSATPITAGYMKLKNIKNLVVVSPDEGGVKRASYMATALGTEKRPKPLAIISKFRTGHSQVGKMRLIGNVRGKVALIIDDMIDTGGTICKAAQLLKDKGATKVIVMSAHPIFNRGAWKKLDAAPIDEVVVTDTVPLSRAAKKVDKISQITVANLIAEAIGRKQDNASLRDLCE